MEDKQNRPEQCVCVHTSMCADEILPVEFLYGEYEAGLVWLLNRVFIHFGLW